MARQDINNEIESRIHSFVQELSGLVREAALVAVQQALEGGTSQPRATSAGRSRTTAGSGRTSKKKAATSKAPAKKAPRKKAGGQRIRRSEEEIAALGQQVLEHVRSNPGERLEQIGAALQIPTAELKRPVSNLMEAKALRTQGQKRGTKYFVAKRGAKA